MQHELMTYQGYGARAISDRLPGTAGRREPCPRRRSWTLMRRSISYGAIAFNRPRPGASLALEEVET
jgi:hypothetical protein